MYSHYSRTQHGQEAQHPTQKYNKESSTHHSIIKREIIKYLSNIYDKAIEKISVQMESSKHVRMKEFESPSSYICIKNYT